MTAARAAWLVVLLLWPVALLNRLDRQMLAAVKFSVMGDVPTIATDASIGGVADWGLVAAVDTPFRADGSLPFYDIPSLGFFDGVRPEGTA